MIAVASSPSGCGDRRVNFRGPDSGTPPVAGTDATVAPETSGKESGGASPDVASGGGVPDAAAEPAGPPPADRPGDASSPTDTGAPGPLTCTQDRDCKLASLRCLSVAGQQAGACVECVNDGNCSAPGARHCEPSLHRCVECLPTTVTTDCPTISAAYPATCTPVSHRCMIGCSDDSTAQMACPTTRSYTCNDDRYLCVECLLNTDCAASPHGQICHPSEFVCVQCTSTTCPVGQTCDAVTGRCMECRSSADCRAPGLPLCDPASYTCIALPPG